MTGFSPPCVYTNLVGGGDLPKIIVNHFIKNNIKFFCIGFLKNPFNSYLKKFNYQIINFGKNNFDSLKQTINIKPLFDNLPNRVDQYWQAYILKSKHSFNVAIKLRLEEIQGLDIINDIENREPVGLSEDK